jgi:hypothetical protein
VVEADVAFRPGDISGFRGGADITDDFLVKDDKGKGAATATWRYRPVRVIPDFNNGKRNRVTPRQARRVWR